MVHLQRRARGCRAAALPAFSTVLLLAGPVASAGAALAPDARAYAEHCAECHGASLGGGRAPPLLDAKWTRPGGADALQRSIREGVPARGMPAFSGVLPPSTLDAIAMHVLARNAAAGAERVFAPTAGDREESDLHDYRIEPLVVAGLDRPRSIALLAEGGGLVTDARGLRRFDASGLRPEPIEGLPAHDALEDVSPHPDYARHGWIYLTYVCSSACGHAERHRYAVARGRLRDGRWSDGEVLAWFGDGDASYGVAKLAFDGAGHVYFTLSGAERPGLDPADFEAEIARPRDLGSHRGKVFRLRDDGGVPRDNPFVDLAGALPAIWSSGHRGLSGLAYDRETGALWATEHGPWGGDELNRIEPGADYGWPAVSFGYHYGGAPRGAAHAADVRPPVFHWTPAIGISNVLVYRGSAFPRWQGHVFVGALGERIGRTLYRFQLDDGRARLYAYPTDADGRVLRDGDGRPRPRASRFEEVAPDVGRIRDLREGPDGYLYLLLEHPDRVVRLVPVEPSGRDAGTPEGRP
ncbi:MAG: PQQ-dependent sugar dehydrogenase [Steroidobacteraceae bacterium]|nr:PQQ-dependent sugar dehydrogenase [Steroidobacteraceae bacterium]